MSITNKKKKKRKKLITTIAVTLPTKKWLQDKLQGTRDSYEDLIIRLLNGITDVYVEFLAVDFELPQTHTIIMQLGNDVNSLYFWDGEKTIPITIQDAQRLIKTPSNSVSIDIEDLDSWLKTNATESEKVTVMRVFEEYVKNRKAVIKCLT